MGKKNVLLKKCNSVGVGVGGTAVPGVLSVPGHLSGTLPEAGTEDQAKNA